MFNFSDPAAQKLSTQGVQYEAHSEGSLLILLDVTHDEELINEGIAREMINRIQKLRKKAHLVPTDEAFVYYKIYCADDSKLAKVMVSHKKVIENTTKTPLRNIGDLHMQPDHVATYCETHIVRDAKLRMWVARNITDISKQIVSLDVQNAHVFVTIENLQLRYDAALIHKKEEPVKILLYHARFGLMTHERLKKEIELVFGIYGCSYDLYLQNKKFIVTMDNTPVDVNLLNENLIKVVRPGILPHDYFIGAEFDATDDDEAIE